MNNTAHRIVLLLLLIWSPHVIAWSWADLWVTPNQQGQNLMKQGKYKKAEETFARTDWRAAAAYRAGHYEQAAKWYASQQDVQGYYNQGNALAHMGNYEAALAAYDKALTMEPDHQDALHNRKVIADLLKKDKERQEKEQKQPNQSHQGKQDQGKQDQGKQDQGKQDQGKQDQGKQDQGKQDQGKQDQGKQDQGKQDQGKQDQGKQDQGKQDQGKQDQGKQDQGKQDQDKQDQDKQDQNNASDQKLQSNKQEQQPADASGKQPATGSQTEEEQEHAKEQLLRLVPDDPGGLMREKFLRDHLRRQRGWY
ncbi:tetratricopeptide repeat protein [Legionella impletisoli]|nr:tetratricopeptide repeat protein [Legionella impletisoli]